MDMTAEQKKQTGCRDAPCCYLVENAKTEGIKEFSGKLLSLFKELEEYYFVADEWNKRKAVSSCSDIVKSLLKEYINE